MKRLHKRLIGIGLIVMLAAWLAWMLLMTESDTDQPIESGSIAAQARVA
jgi:hypothetical protein